MPITPSNVWRFHYFILWFSLSSNLPRIPGTAVSCLFEFIRAIMFSVLPALFFFCHCHAMFVLSLNYLKFRAIFFTHPRYLILMRGDSWKSPHCVAMAFIARDFTAAISMPIWCYLHAIFPFWTFASILPYLPLFLPLRADLMQVIRGRYWAAAFTWACPPRMLPYAAAVHIAARFHYDYSLWFATYYYYAYCHLCLRCLPPQLMPFRARFRSCAIDAAFPWCFSLPLLWTIIAFMCHFSPSMMSYDIIRLPFIARLSTPTSCLPAISLFHFHSCLSFRLPPLFTLFAPRRAIGGCRHYVWWRLPTRACFTFAEPLTPRYALLRRILPFWCWCPTFLSLFIFFIIVSHIAPDCFSSSILFCL